MPDDLKTMREAAAKNALAPKEASAAQAWREQADSIIAEAGIDEQGLAEIRGHPQYMEFWKEGARAHVPEPDLEFMEWVKKKNAEYGLRPPPFGPPKKEKTLRSGGATYSESARSTGHISRTIPPGARGQRALLARRLGQLEGEMAAYERRLRGEEKPKTTPPEEP